MRDILTLHDLLKKQCLNLHANSRLSRYFPWHITPQAGDFIGVFQRVKLPVAYSLLNGFFIAACSL